MFASSTGPRSALRRRGIVLVLVLGMLGLMALIGVTFATFAGQSLKNGRNFSQGLGRPGPEALMDYALAQLINDTSNPLSAIRGHSLLRDMYGNDSNFRGSNPAQNAVAETGGILPHMNGVPLRFTAAGLHPASPDTPFYNQVQYTTNIPTTGPYAGYDFTRWIVRFTNAAGAQTSTVPQTFEVLGDDFSGPFHLFTLSANLGNPAADNFFSPAQLSSGDPYSFIYADPNFGATQTAAGTSSKNFTALNREYSGAFQGNVGTASNAFVLDGRYMRAFNGPGLTRPVPAVPYTDPSTSTTYFVNYPFNQAAYGNMRLAGQINGFDPDGIGMDEDYDACDLENWFLAIQSADGQVMIPSFHRPGILTGPGTNNAVLNDWTSPNLVQRAKILRPRQIDNSPLFPADPSVLDANGKLTYDIDNDGDGVTDSVWLDLGYPVQRDPNGKLYKPLFAFMVLGLNGRLPLNTVGNLQARAIGDTTNNATDGVPFPSSSGQVPYPGPYSFATTGANHNPLYSSQVFFDTPLYDHASHLGFSVNEINPKFALQNAPSNLVANGSDPYASTTGVTTYGQIDNAGVNVALTQLRNLLAGARPTTTTNPYTGTLPTNSSEFNLVAVAGKPWLFPNGVYDLSDNNGTITTTSSTAPAVPGRWGEPEGIPGAYPSPFSSNAFDTTYPIHWYNNPVRAGRSVGTTDATDDDFDGFDPYLPTQLQRSTTFTLLQNQTTGTPDTIPLNSAAAYAGPTFNRIHPEDVDAFDNAGQMAVASERARRFVTPRDTAGIGRKVTFIPYTTSPNILTRPQRDHDFGFGPDQRGRLGFFRYFRPAGMPQEVRYPYPDDGTTNNLRYPYATNSGLGHRYLMPVLLPAGRSAANGAGPVSTADVSNNRWHGLQAAMTPQVVAATPPSTVPPLAVQTIATLAAMPFDWDPSLNSMAGGVAGGYNDQDLGGGLKLQLFSPTINPAYSVLSNANTSNGPNLGAVGNTTGVYPLPYGANYTQAASSNGVTLEQATGAPVVNGYLGGGLNKDEADEMNLYLANNHDMPFGPSDLEWLYRKHDVDGASLNSRLSGLAPISFLNPADGLTRRRLFSTDSWELNRFAYANDNPIAYAGYLGGNGPHSVDHDFTYNSRFLPNASPSLEIMNQVPPLDATVNPIVLNPNFANPYTAEFLPNPTLPTHTLAGGTINSYIPNSSFSAASPVAMPRQLDPANTTNLFSTNIIPNAQINPYTSVIIPAGGQASNIPLSAAQVQTPSLAHLDRKINLNFPLPISNDPAEPIRQKWCRETYQMLKAILPPASVDTPEELAALSQFVVNIIDFRDPDPTMTRFVNTDLEVTDVLTKKASNQQIDPATGQFDKTWTVSPAGVRFAQNPITSGHSPFDPSLYSPDSVTPFLVQHGMEYNPIAINEVLSYQAKYGDSATSRELTNYQTMFIELINTLTESQNNPGGAANSSDVSLVGWDLVVVPDNYGWGRPDPISGDLNPVVLQPYVPNPTGSVNAAPDPLPAATDGNVTSLRAAVSQMPIVAGTPAPVVQALRGNSNPDVFIIGDYRVRGVNGVGGTSANPAGGGTGPTANGPIETTPVVANSQINLRLPTSFNLPNVPAGRAMYYWVYLRRPANPFDTERPNQVRPNKEMVVVDAMRFPAINASDSTNTGEAGAMAAITRSPQAIYSAQRLQPYRGGHLIRVDTDPTPPTGVSLATALPTAGTPAFNVTRICPPSPPYAYGYSEQTAKPPATSATSSTAVYPYPNATNGRPTTQPIQHSLNSVNPNADTTWAHFPFHDRDFTSVAELLLVPGCPPGLFTKQFVEEPYPGNIYLKSTAPYPTAYGTDNRDFKPTIVAPTGGNGPAGNPPPQSDPSDESSPSLAGRQNFNAANNTLPRPTFPYLTDNFYYTAASVAPPTPGGTIDPGYTRLTTEIGGWTGAGWHKMLEFFEVPSSANGAIGSADGGDNYDWYRADVKPGLLNLNLIMDDEVFAGLIDDPRLNENLAYATSAIPRVVSQIDPNGYPVVTTSGLAGAADYGYPIFPNANASMSYLITPAGGSSLAAGRGYAYRDPNIADYPGGVNNYQQVHGLKAAFSDFLKLRHGGSGYLFAHGGGDVGMGNYPSPLAFPPTTPTQPVAADRPFRSPSYPDINYTIMRPASLPPSPLTSSPVYNSPGTAPPLPIPGSPTGVTVGLPNLLSYAPATGAPFVQLNQLLAPMNDTTQRYQYVQDPGLKNPYLAVQYANTGTPAAGQPLPTDPPLSKRRLAPPYDAVQGLAETPPRPIAAPFPPPIPPVPARRLFQIPDDVPTAAGGPPTSNASLLGSVDPAGTAANGNEYPVNSPVITATLSTGIGAPFPTPPTLVVANRAVFAADNLTPQSAIYHDPNPIFTAPYKQANNFLGAGSAGDSPASTPFDLRQHPVYRTEWLQKISNLTTVRTHQFAVWITVGFFEVVKTGTPELAIPDVLGQELGSGAGNSTRYRSFFVVDRTRATGFNPYYPGDFRTCVAYRRRIE